MHTPKSLGYFMPAEWHTQSSTWVSWPHNEETWPGKHSIIKQKFAEVIATISRYQTVSLICKDSLEAECNRMLNAAMADLRNVRRFNIDTNDIWCRDYGPTFLINREKKDLSFVNWQFNAWGGKYPAEKDNLVNASIASELKLQQFPQAIFCEGGGLEVNGTGLLLTSESVVLNPNRNPTLTKVAANKIFESTLGVSDICWLKSGLHNDDTDGHIDMLARFYQEDAIVAIITNDKKHPDYAVLQHNYETLKNFRTSAGRKFEITTIPIPETAYSEDGKELSLSYANFLIINGAVLVPTYRQKKNDDYALGFLGDLFPKRKIIGIDCLDIIEEGGAIHCMTQQQPAP